MPKFVPQERLEAKLFVRSDSPWGRRIEFNDRLGSVVRVKNYQEARDYAKEHGYSGIKIVA